MRKILVVSLVVVLSIGIAAVAAKRKKQRWILPQQPAHEVWVADNPFPPGHVGPPIIHATKKVEPAVKSYSVSPALDDPKQDKELATKVATILETAQPDNVSRHDHFNYLNDEDSFFVWRGWNLNVKKVEEIAGGWRAEIWVNPLVQTKDDLPGFLVHSYVEVYEFKNSKLRLVKGYPHPKGVRSWGRF